jgi:hypothetical protein
MRVNSIAFDVALPGIGKEETYFEWNHDGSEINDTDEPDYRIKLNYGVGPIVCKRRIPLGFRSANRTIRLYNMLTCILFFPPFFSLFSFVLQ